MTRTLDRPVREAWIVEAVRTPIGRFGGALASVRPDDLAAAAIRAVVDRSGIDPGLIEDVRDIRPEWLAGARRVGVTAGASTPEILVSETIEALRHDDVTVREVRVVEEDVRFGLPQELERMARERNVTLPSRDVMRQSI